MKSIPRAKTWRPKFLEHLRKSGNVTASAEVAGVTRQTAYNHYRRSERFAAKWEAALDESIERMEGEARRRAVDGVAEPVFYQGKKVGVVQRYSDTLLIFLLKAHKPDMYRDRSSVELTGAGGGPVTVREVVVKLREDDEPAQPE